MKCGGVEVNCYDLCFAVCIMAVQFISGAEQSVMTVFSLFCSC